jgi:hypothetical protein
VAGGAVGVVGGAAQAEVDLVEEGGVAGAVGYVGAGVEGGAADFGDAVAQREGRQRPRARR